MLHKMKTGGLKMLQKGPNFKNFPGKNSLLNLRIPAQLGVYAALLKIFSSLFSALGLSIIYNPSSSEDIFSGQSTTPPALLNLTLSATQGGSCSLTHEFKWKCNCPMNPHVLVIAVLLTVGLSYFPKKVANSNTFMLLSEEYITYINFDHLLKTEV